MTTSARLRRVAAVLAIIAPVAAATLVPVTARAAAPATVTVTVDGFYGALVPQTQVTTTATPIYPDGTHACSPTSAGGALWDATGGHWDGAYGSFGYEVDGIAGVDFAPFSANAGLYWNFMLNGQVAQQGACAQELNNGDAVVMSIACYPPSATSPVHLLWLGQPSATSLDVSQALKIGVGSCNTTTGLAEALPAGTSVVATTGPASPSAAPDGAGQATLTFPAAGTYTLQAQAPGAAASAPVTVCVHDGSDGNCGTTASPTATTSPQPQPQPQPKSQTQPSPIITTTATGQVLPARTRVVAFAATLSGLRNSAVYALGRAPRTITGTVTSPDSLRWVKLRLTRRAPNGRCAYYDGVTERFRRMRCGAAHGRYLSVGSSSAFSYLLPGQLGPGRYVLDLQARDAAGRLTPLRHGSTRIVFYVRRRATRPRHARRAGVAAAPVVQLMVVGPHGILFGPRRVPAAPTTVAVGRRRCSVAGGTALAALQDARGEGGPMFTLRDYGRCSSRQADAGQLFVSAISIYAGRGSTGWEYKVDDHAGTTGAGDASGPLGNGRLLRSGARVLWYLCTLRGGGCQRTLRISAPSTARHGARVRVTVLAENDLAKGRAQRGALVTAGSASARTDARGHATITMPRGGATATVTASAPGVVTAFPVTIALR